MLSFFMEMTFQLFELHVTLGSMTSSPLLLLDVYSFPYGDGQGALVGGSLAGLLKKMILDV